MKNLKKHRAEFLFGLLGVAIFMVSAMPSEAMAVTREWVRRYNGTGNSGDEVTAMATGTDGSVYVTGRSIGSVESYYDYVTIKYAPDGSRVWTRRLDGIGNNYDVPNAIAVDASGNVYVTGGSAGRDDGSGAALDILTVKYNTDGKILWTQRYNGSGNSYDAGWDLAVDQFGCVFVTGETTGTGTAFGDSITIKYAPDGNTLWIRNYNGPANYRDYAYALALDASGNVYVTGSSSNGSTTDFLTIKYGSDGQRFWARLYDGPFHFTDGARDIAVDGAGNVYVSGVSWNSESRSDDNITIKYTTNGERQWARRYEGPGKGDDIVEKIAVDNAGNCYVTGWSVGAGSNGYDYATIKYDPSGNRLWVRRYNGPANGFDSAHGIVLDGEGNAYVTGASSTSWNGYDFVTIKYDEFGNLAWLKRYNGPCSSNDSGRAIAIDGSGNVYVAGDSYCPASGSDYSTVKYAP
ncbi:MAG: hypothetical protein FIB02_01575 [Desulfuromonas sp.]|nr:hypothetical protein [Desulfuromonas sp.]